MSIIRHGLLTGVIQVAKHRAQARASCEQARRLARRKFHGILLGQIHSAQLGQLHKLAFHHVLRQFDQHVQDFEIALGQRHLKRLHVQPVAGQHAAMVSPAGIGRGTPAPRVRAINHIVMDQSGAVDQFNDRAQTDRAVPPVSRRIPPQAAAGPAAASCRPLQQIAGDFRDWFDGRAILERKLLLDLDKVVANKIKDFLRCQK